MFRKGIIFIKLNVLPHVL